MTTYVPLYIGIKINGSFPRNPNPNLNHNRNLLHQNGLRLGFRLGSGIKTMKNPCSAHIYPAADTAATTAEGSARRPVVTGVPPVSSLPPTRRLLQLKEALGAL